MVQLKKNKEVAHIRQSNAITNARHSLSCIQLDIYFMILNILKPACFEYELNLKQIEEMTGRTWNHKQLKIAIKDMISKVFEIDESDRILQVSLLSSATYFVGKSTIQLTIAPGLMPYLINLKKNFTDFELYSVLSMSSTYAKSIYMHCSRWKNTKHLKFDLDDLKTKLNVKNKTSGIEKYSQWGEFKKNVLDITVRQINEYSDLNIRYTIEKKGRKISKVAFDIIIKKKSQMITPFSLNNER